MAPERPATPHPPVHPSRPTRRIPVLVGSLPIEDGQTPPPAVGEVGRFPLIFGEADPDDPGVALDATVATFRVRAEPGGDGSPRRGGWRGPEVPRLPEWPTILHGDGWSASWRAPRPVLGEIEVTGTIVGDLGFESRQWVRGTVVSAAVVVETFTLGEPEWPGGPGRPRRVSALQRLRPVQRSPRWFDHGLVPDPDGPATGWVAMVRPERSVEETGVLVLLDLDDVPPLPLRPSIVPGAIAASGDDLRVADVRLPLVCSAGAELVRACPWQGTETHAHPLGHEMVEHTWPGRILRPEDARGRGLHADADGCWVTGPDGVRRIDRDGAVDVVLDEPVWHAAACGEGLAVQLVPGSGGRVAEPSPRGPVEHRLVGRDGTVTDLDLAGCTVDALVPDDAGALTLVHDDAGARLARIGPDGAAAVGPVLKVGHPGLLGLVPGDPPLVVDETGRGVRRVRPDLTLEEAAAPGWARVLLGFGAGGRRWFVTHPPRPRGVDALADDAHWPLAAEPTYPDDRQYWLLTEVDAALAPVRTTLVPGIPEHVAVTGDGTVWFQAGALYRVPDDEAAPAEPVDLAAVLDRHRRR